MYYLKKIIDAIKIFLRKNDIVAIEAFQQDYKENKKDFIDELKDMVIIKCCGEVRLSLRVGDGTGIQEDIKY